MLPSPNRESSQSMLVTIIIPCCNEVDSLPRLFNELQRLPHLLGPAHFPELLLLDDGSTDGTAVVARAWCDRSPFPTRIIGFDANRGLGAMLREAAEFAQGDALVTYDADLPYPLEDLPAMLAALLAGADVVTASPWHPAGSAQVSWWRAALSRTISKLYRLRLGRRAQGLHTFTCGYRVWRAATYRASLPTRDGFVATAEMLLRALRSGARAVELPSALRPRLEGVSKLRVLRTACAHLRLLLRG